jgi:hypothetical protein
MKKGTWSILTVAALCMVLFATACAATKTTTITSTKTATQPVTTTVTSTMPPTTVKSTVTSTILTTVTTSSQPITTTITSTVTTTLPPITTTTTPPITTGSPIIATTSLLGGKVNTAYSQTLAASGGSGIFTAWSVTSGALPGGLTLAPSTGVISGTPNTVGTFNFTVKVTDSAGATATQALSIVIAAATSSPIINPNVFVFSNGNSNGKINIAYSGYLSASGGSGFYTAWSVISGALPGGLTLAPSTGYIYGTPTTAGTFNFTVQVTDSAGATATQALSIVIAAAATGSPIITTTSLQGGKVNTAYSQTLAASGGSGIFTAWSVTSSALPGGLTLAPSTGVISGTPNTAGTFNFTVQVTDSNNATATQALTIVITLT